MRIHLLEEAIRHHQECYDDGKPEISDAAFDQLVDELRSHSPQSAVLDLLRAKPVEGGVTHATPMLSLEKTYDAESLEAFVQRVDCKDDTWPAVIQPKYDGVACSILYTEGKLVRAATRGDGLVGEDITHVVAGMSCVPSTLRDKLSFEVRGELLMSINEFDQHWRDKGFKNPRNTVAGLISRKTVADKGALAFVAYDLIGVRGASQVNRCGMLVEIGFRAADCFPTTADTVVAQVREIADATSDVRTDTDFELDGLVIKANSAQAESLGATAHHPRWAIAYKFETEAKTAKLVRVEWAVSRHGTITPVAVMSPVELSGATVTRATLHSWGRVTALGLRLGATLEVVRRGGVIPHVNSAKGGTTPVLPPDVCPSCRCSAVLAGGDSLRCTNPRCGGIQEETISHWCRSTGMLGWGPEVVRKLLLSGVVRAVPHLYKLTEERLREAGVGVGTARNLMRAVDKARTLTPDVFFAALGFPQLGLENVRNLLHHVHWRELVTEPAAHFTRLEQQRVITSARRELLISQFERGQDLLDELLACVSIKDAEHAVTGRYFSGKNVVFTGVLEDMDRGVAQELVRAQGGLTPSSVTKRTHVLVVGNLAPGEQTIKLEKAKKYGVEIMDGEAFACALAENT